jgi:hypothetical protein
VDSLPDATLVATSTTADAAHDVAERGDPTHVAIASERAARARTRLLRVLGVYPANDEARPAIASVSSEAMRVMP